MGACFKRPVGNISHSPARFFVSRANFYLGNLNFIYTYKVAPAKNNTCIICIEFAHVKKRLHVLYVLPITRII